MTGSFRTIVGVLLASTLALSACSGQGIGGSAAGKQYRIGAYALVPFTQIQDMLGGFKQAFNDCGLVEGKNTTYFIDFAQGQQATLQLLAKRYLDSNVDLILSMDTPSMITAAGATQKVPIVEVAATYPVQSGVIQSLEHPGTNVTGGTDYLDPKFTVDTMLEALPNVKSVGIIYNPSEQNSAEFQKAIRKELDARSLKLTELSVTNTAEVEPAVRGLVGKVDAILLGADNTAIAAAATIADVAMKNKIPFVSYISGVAKKGALLDLGVDYQVLGQQAGQKGCDILLKGKNPADMPITGVPKPILTVNTDTASSIGVTLPASILDRATK